jgi:hypothetical protein
MSELVINLLVMGSSVQQSRGTVPFVHFRLIDLIKDDVLVGRESGHEARAHLEREIRRIGLRAPDHPVAVDFDAIRSISVPFAEELFVPLLAGRLAGFYEEHPFLVVRANADVSETLAAALRPHNLSVLGVSANDVDLLGGEQGLREAVRAAHELGTFSVGDLAQALGVSQQTANVRLNSLHRIGAIGRRRIVPPGGGREYEYRVPTQEDISLPDPDARVSV